MTRVNSVRREIEMSIIEAFSEVSKGKNFSGERSVADTKIRNEILLPTIELCCLTDLHRAYNKK